MTKILTRFYLEDGAWAKLQYIAALMHKPPKDVAELIMLSVLDALDEDEVVTLLVHGVNVRKARSKKGRKK